MGQAGWNRETDWRNQLSSTSFHASSGAGFHILPSVGFDAEYSHALGKEQVKN